MQEASAGSATSKSHEGKTLRVMSRALMIIYLTKCRHPDILRVGTRLSGLLPIL